nr:MAG TPA: hypothetical protein [Caudoviricetes sp.]
MPVRIANSSCSKPANSLAFLALSLRSNVGITPPVFI